MSQPLFDKDLDPQYMFEFYNEVSEKVAAANSNEAFKQVKLHMEKISG